MRYSYYNDLILNYDFTKIDAQREPFCDKGSNLIIECTMNVIVQLANIITIIIANIVNVSVSNHYFLIPFVRMKLTIAEQNFVRNS